MVKLSRNQLRKRRKRRIRAKISGTRAVPRVAVFRSARMLYAQVIDDKSGKVITAASGKELGKKYRHSVAGARDVGKLVGKKCIDKKISKVVFDRSGYAYHGKVRALAEGIREAGVQM